MTSIGTRIYTWLKGERVGSDAFGNTYYREKGGRRSTPLGFGRERRWVLYAGAAEASTVPPEWHGWLHQSVKEPPGELAPHVWEQPHQPNHTGTDAAYRPPGHQLAAGSRAAATGDYQAWTPPV